jgi:hypothetical protein
MEATYTKKTTAKKKGYTIAAKATPMTQSS